MTRSYNSPNKMCASKTYGLNTVKRTVKTSRFNNRSQQVHYREPIYIIVANINFMSMNCTYTLFFTRERI